jgi:hypothetical protein
MTAIDCLINELRPTICLQQKYIDEIKEQAKSMEKQQIIDAWDDCFFLLMADLKPKTAEEYYNETYNQPNQ